MPVIQISDFFEKILSVFVFSAFLSSIADLVTSHFLGAFFCSLPMKSHYFALEK